MFPFQVHAQLSQQTKIHFDNPNWSQEVIFKGADDFAPIPKASPIASPDAKIAHYAASFGGSCVTYAKRVLNRSNEVWGNGGRRLFLTQTPFLGAVVVFTYTHVAVITGIVGDMLYITESNYSARNTISNRSIPIDDPTIKGFN